MTNENDNRREVLKKIGLALAAVTAAGTLGLPVEAQERKTVRTPSQFKIPEGVRSAVTQGTFDVFVVRKGADASALVVPSSDASSIAALRSSTKAAPAKAQVINGVLHIGLGAAASRSSVLNQGAINFEGARVPEAGLFTR